MSEFNIGDKVRWKFKDEKWGDHIIHQVIYTVVSDNRAENKDGGFIELDDPTIEIEFVEEAKPEDNVNNPQHYNKSGIECIQAIRAALTEEEFRGFIKGNVLKYTWRERYKNQEEDLKKAEWYLSHFNSLGD